MCNVIDDYREEELSEVWKKIERRKWLFSYFSVVYLLVNEGYFYLMKNF
jgi:hypothetical protein